MYKNRPTLIIGLISAMLLLSNIKVVAQSSQEALRSALNKHAIPFLLPDGPEHPALKTMFEGRQVIALGEASHGTHEFYSAKTEIIKYLVQQQQVKVVALETDFCGIEEINAFVQNKFDNSANTDPRFTALYGMYGIYRTAETYDLVKWLKAYNSDKPASEKVSISGLDMQDPYYITKSILEDVKDIAIDSADLKLLQKIKDDYWSAKELKITKATQASYDNLIANLNRIAAIRNEDTANSLFKRHLRLLEQTFALRGQPMATYRSRRDEYLAENAFWLLNNRSNNVSKMVIWAHNGHISYSGDQKLKRLGYHLKEKLGHAYFALALTFDEGDVRIYDFKGKPKGYKSFPYPPATRKNAIEYLLSKCRDSNFLIDFKGISADQSIMDELNKYQYMRVIGAEYLKGEQNIFFKTPILSSFDGILFFRRTTAALALPNERSKS